MKRVYETQNLKDLKKVLEADPYGEKSFARQGYTLRDGKTLGEDATKYYLLISADDEFFKLFEPKFIELAPRCKHDLEHKVIKKIEEEEEAAQGGFGSLFG
ncbi:Uncharacterised protein [Candidatus Gugararchaeum adminiculabundum]|nr:Uncharacterised protein [Candidatus Gugararchaeum adminiculabundum]